VIAAGRGFYETPQEKVIKSLITETVEQRDEQVIDDYTTTNNIKSTNIPEYGNTNINSYTIARVNGETLFLGFPENTQGSYNIKFKNYSYNGDELSFIRFQLLSNNIADYFEIYAEYIDGENVLRWELGNIQNYKDAKLRVEYANSEDATMDPQNEDDGTFKLIFKLTGKLAEPRAVALDALKIKAYNVIDRDLSEANDIDVSSFTAGEDRPITRRFTNSVGEEIYSLQQESNKELKKDGLSITGYEKNSSKAFLNITEGNSQVVEADIDTDYTNIINRVVVVGDRNIQAAYKVSNSINYYDVEKTKIIEDYSISQKSEAEERAREFLRENAFEDTIMSFKIANPNIYKNVNVGDIVSVDWDDISGNFIVKDINDSTDDYTEIKLTGNI